MRVESERRLHTRHLGRMRTGVRRSDDIAQEMKIQNVDMTGEQCKSKWERLVADFKKVYDYQSDKPSGVPSYFDMTLRGRKRHHLPPSFDEEIYDLLECWLPNQ
jgi:hypothetical protein